VQHAGAVGTVGTQSDPAWRWGAWTCTSLALWMIVSAPF
jgi:hypothetical protein